MKITKGKAKPRLQTINASEIAMTCGGKPKAR